MKGKIRYQWYRIGLLLGIFLILGLTNQSILNLNKTETKSQIISPPSTADSPPASPTLNLISSNPSYDGSVSITWTLSLQANCYYLFQDINPILTTSGLNYIANLTTNSYNETLGTVGTYYYAVVAANQFGNSSISNNVNV